MLFYRNLGIATQNYMSDRSEIWYFEEVNLFEYFCPITNGQEKYDKHPKREFKKGEFIYFSDDDADRVFFIHSGAVKVAGYTDEEEVIKAILHPGEIFGEMAVYGETKRGDFAPSSRKNGNLYPRSQSGGRPYV